MRTIQCLLSCLPSSNQVPWKGKLRIIEDFRKAGSCNRVSLFRSFKWGIWKKMLLHCKSSSFVLKESTLSYQQLYFREIYFCFTPVNALPHCVVRNSSSLSHTIMHCVSKQVCWALGEPGKAEGHLLDSIVIYSFRYRIITIIYFIFLDGCTFSLHREEWGWANAIC